MPPLDLSLIQSSEDLITRQSRTRYCMSGSDEAQTRSLRKDTGNPGRILCPLLFKMLSVWSESPSRGVDGLIQGMGDFHDAHLLE